MHTGGGGEGGRGVTSCTPYKEFEKLPHKNAIKTSPSSDFLTTPSTPLKRIYQKPQGPPPPWISNYCASMSPSISYGVCFASRRRLPSFKIIREK
jgi:hypothetical protein